MSNYEIKEQSPTEAIVRISVASDEVNDALNSTYEHYANRASIPGFRKGHIPRNLLNARFGEELFLEETQQQLQQQHLGQAISELELTPVTSPEVDAVSFATDEGYVFDASFSVLPSFELPEYKAIELEVEPEQEPTDEQLEAALEEVCKQYSTLVPKDDSTVCADDIVQLKKDGSEEEWETRVEEDSNVTGKLIGHNVGESVELDVKLPNGKDYKTSVTIAALKSVRLPEIDDELAKDAGYDDLAKMKDALQEKMQKELAERRISNIKFELLDKLVEKADIPLPEALVEESANKELGNLEKQFSHPQSPASLGEYLEKQGKTKQDLLDDYRESVATKMRRELMLQRLVEQEGIEIDDDKLKELANEDADDAGENPIRFTAQLKANDRWEDYRMSKINNRALDILHDNAQLTQKKEEKE